MQKYGGQMSYNTNITKSPQPKSRGLAPSWRLRGGADYFNSKPARISFCLSSRLATSLMPRIPPLSLRASRASPIVLILNLFRLPRRERLWSWLTYIVFYDKICFNLPRRFGVRTFTFEREVRFSQNLQWQVFMNRRAKICLSEKEVTW